MKIKSSLLVIILLLNIIIFFSCSSENGQVKDEIIAMERDSLISRADAYLNEPVQTITDTSCERSAGGLHDYYSEGTYWWPDSTNPDGPYIRKDGYFNPDNFNAHLQLINSLNRIVPTLVTAYIITNDEKYINPAKRHLLAWFVDEETKMNPNMLYAQAIHGRVTGRGIGIIDSKAFIDVARSCKVLKDRGKFSTDELAGLEKWFKEFTTWLTTHQYGIDERDHGNNHSTAWALQVAAYSQFTGDKTNFDFCRNLYKTFLLPHQMTKEGKFPDELGRTKPYAYSLFNMEAMSALCWVVSIPEDNLWNYTYQDTLNIRKAIDFMFPYIKDKSKWPYPPDVTGFDHWPVRQNSLLFAYFEYGDKKYYDLWKSLYKEANSGNLRRSVFIHQPILWLN